MTPQPETSSSTKPCPEELWKQLSHAITLRTGGDQVVWTVCSIFAATNAVLLNTLFLDGKFSKPAGLIVGLVGAALALAWSSMQERVLAHLDRYEDVMRTLETALQLDQSFRVTKLMGAADDRQYFRDTFRAKRTLRWIPRLAFWFWA